VSLVGVDVERVDELAEDLELLVYVRLRLDSGLVQDRLRGEDLDSGSNRQGERVGRPRVHLDGSAVQLQLERGVVGLSARLEMITRRSFAPIAVRVAMKRSWVSGRSGATP
jgi:hypothetical protein